MGSPNGSELSGAQVGQMIRHRLMELRMSQPELARLVAADLGEEPVVQSAITRWLNDAGMIARHRMFAIERVLGYHPGTLSRNFGYLPVVAAPPVSTSEVIQADPRLSADSKRVLLVVYQALLSDDAKLREEAFTSGPRGPKPKRRAGAGL